MPANLENSAVATGVEKVSFILIPKRVFELSYNDLKVTVQNCNYVCINLIESWQVLNRKIKPGRGIGES